MGFHWLEYAWEWIKSPEGLIVILTAIVVSVITTIITKVFPKVIASIIKIPSFLKPRFVMLKRWKLWMTYRPKCNIVTEESEIIVTSVDNNEYMITASIHVQFKSRHQHQKTIIEESVLSLSFGNPHIGCYRLRLSHDGTVRQFEMKGIETTEKTYQFSIVSDMNPSLPEKIKCILDIGNVIVVSVDRRKIKPLTAKIKTFASREQND